MLDTVRSCASFAMLANLAWHVLVVCPLSCRCHALYWFVVHPVHKPLPLHVPCIAKPDDAHPALPFVPGFAACLSSYMFVEYVHSSCQNQIHNRKGLNTLTYSANDAAGPPQLMMAFTEEGQADPLMVAKRDKLYGTNSEQRKEHRRQTLDFSHQPSPAADHWMQGKGAHQLQAVNMDFKSGELSASGCYTSAGEHNIFMHINSTHQAPLLMLRMVFPAAHSLLLPR